MHLRQLSLAALFFVIVTFDPHPAQACSSCGCTLNSDWATQGLSVGKGWRFDIRYDYFNQTELRSDDHNLDRSSIVLPDEREIQQSTVNRNYSLGLAYNPNREWGINIQLPYFDRLHTTITPGDTGISTSHSQSMGDLRVIGHYQGFSQSHNTGIQFGIKLPTGNFHNNFISGPQNGEPLDRGLQPGSGTTDILLGAYHFDALNQQWDYFAEALWQQPLNTRESFKPGAGINVNIGIRYAANSTFIPQLQINARSEGRESGNNADVENSGATLIYFSPGFTVNFNRRLATFAFIQTPLYQHVNGLQIEPRYLASLGMHYIF